MVGALFDDLSVTKQTILPDTFGTKLLNSWADMRFMVFTFYFRHGAVRPRAGGVRWSPCTSGRRTTWLNGCGNTAANFTPSTATSSGSMRSPVSIHLTTGDVGSCQQQRIYWPRRVQDLEANNLCRDDNIFLFPLLVMLSSLLIELVFLAVEQGSASNVHFQLRVYLTRSN